MSKKSNTGLVKSFSLVFISLLIHFSCDHDPEEHTIIKTDNRIEIYNSKVRAVFIKSDSIISQKYYARNQEEWQEVVSAFIPPSEFPNNAVQLFNKDFISSCEKVSKMLDFEPSVSFKEGLNVTTKWLEHHGYLLK